MQLFLVRDLRPGLQIFFLIVSVSENEFSWKWIIIAIYKIKRFM